MTCSCFADMNVGYVLDEAQLTRYFSQYGTVTDCYLPVRTIRAPLPLFVMVASSMLSSPVVCAHMVQNQASAYHCLAVCSDSKLTTMLGRTVQQ